MSFRASYDTTTKVLSAAVFILFLVIAASVRNVISDGVLAFLFLAAYAWSPSGYSVVDGEVVIRRLIGNVHLPVAGIREVRIATRDDLRGSMRIFGSGGLFGYYGLFRNSKLGTSSWYVTNRSQAVVLTSDTGTAIVSPDDAVGFVAALGKPSAGAAPVPDTGISGRSGWITGASVFVGAAIVAAIFLYKPGPPDYTLTKQSLAIHDHFYPVTLNASSVDVSDMRVIDFAKDPDWRPVMRTNGFGSEHYHSGWFRVSSGRTVRMYRADSTRVVLLPPKGDGTAVLLEAKEPDQFLAALRREWGDEQPSTTGN
jgi:PH (Pleckstrin Homology) domain-containing protein